MYKNRYHQGSIRIKNWNYEDDAFYFITICTQNKRKYFGKIENDIVNLSTIGKIAEQFWLEIPTHFPFIRLDEFIIMPDHMHGIVIIDKNAPERSETIETTGKPRDFVAAHNCARLRNNRVFQNDHALQKDRARPQKNNEFIYPTGLWHNSEPKNKFGPQSQNLGSVIRAYKSSLKRYANNHGINFHWQKRYYEHIIRDPEELDRIREYIRNNPISYS